VPTLPRQWEVLPIVRIILHCNIIFDALYGIFFRRGEVLIWRWLILRQLLRRLGINWLWRILFGIA
jgi:hypothetical protein